MLAASHRPGIGDDGPTVVADEAGSQPAGAGGDAPRYSLSDRQALAVALAVNSCRSCSFQSDESAVSGLQQEFRVDERSQQGVSNVAVEAPQPLCLCRRQAKSRHFDELTLYPLEHFIDSHVDLPLEESEHDFLDVVHPWRSKACTLTPWVVAAGHLRTQVNRIQILAGMLPESASGAGLHEHARGV